MYIHGHFYNRNEEKIEVLIVTLSLQKNATQSHKC